MRHEYLSHIDILRALAVFLVIFNHLEWSYFGGGFIGVDVFLVISGYLITKNIYKEQENTGKFSFKKFYQRRVIRLAPTFFTVMISCCLSFYFVLTTDEWINFLKTLVSSVTLTSNIYYWTLLGDYFSINAKSTPLLHIWSLSLEEQFYLIWPLFLLFILKIKSNFYSILFLLVIIFASVCVSHFFVLSDPIAAYYLLPSRIFEFCIGGLIAFLPKKNFSKNTSYMFTAISLIIILFASMSINKMTIFPSYIALIPCIGAALFIYFSSAIGDVNFLNPIKYLGKISYPMYLWHWPIIVYLNINSIQLNLFVSIAVILFTIALSIISYEKIEKTIKNYYTKKPQNTIKTFFILPSLIFILYSTIYFYSLEQQKSKQNHLSETSTQTYIQCIDRNPHPMQECFFGDLSLKETKILLLGDSHANAQRGFIDVLAKDANLQGYEVTYSSTAFLPNLERFIHLADQNKIKHIPNFKSINDSNISLIQNNQFKYVILGGYFPHNAERNIYSISMENPDIEKSHQFFISGFENALDIIIKSGAIPIIINDNPILMDVDMNCNLRTSSPQEKCFFDQKKYELDFQYWQHDLTVLKTKYKELIVLDFNPIICPQKVCYSYLGHTPLYRDGQHLTYTGSAEIGVEYLKKYGNPF
ncbi:acyltransferase family protein [Acinetobacter beijerinckii]|uniref:acyltransferase family protein n=1 Tax=Acinetobacter beijerinckii TaxID=262668 RepID=UPI0030D85296